MGPLLLNGLLLFKMFAHGRLDLAGGYGLAGGLGLWLDRHATDIPRVDCTASHGVLGSWDGGFWIHHEKVVVVLEGCYELAEGVTVVIVCTSCRTVLNLIDDHTLRELEGNGVHVICI